MMLSWVAGVPALADDLVLKWTAATSGWSHEKGSLSEIPQRLRAHLIRTQAKRAVEE
jgi:hypothetical protein